MDSKGIKNKARKIDKYILSDDISEEYMEYDEEYKFLNDTMILFNHKKVALANILLTYVNIKTQEEINKLEEFISSKIDSRASRSSDDEYIICRKICKNEFSNIEYDRIYVYIHFHERFNTVEK